MQTENSLLRIIWVQHLLLHSNRDWSTDGDNDVQGDAQSNIETIEIARLYFHATGAS